MKHYFDYFDEYDEERDALYFKRDVDDEAVEEEEKAPHYM